jgi:hypothetical protein
VPQRITDEAVTKIRRYGVERALGFAQSSAAGQLHIEKYCSQIKTYAAQHFAVSGHDQFSLDLGFF